MSSRYISIELRDLVTTRANFVCEYCLISEEDTYFGCQVEHIISRNMAALLIPTIWPMPASFAIVLKEAILGLFLLRQRNWFAFISRELMYGVSIFP